MWESQCITVLLLSSQPSDQASHGKWCYLLHHIKTIHFNDKKMETSANFQANNACNKYD